MIIDFLELNNFISHTGTKIDFAGGINVILGNNGAGKSSMMDGIRFALFGDSGRGNNSDLIHHGNGESTVRLGFHVNEDKYEILRKISITKGEDSKTDAEMVRNGEPYAAGTKSVNSAVESLFRISRELFFNSIFVRQGEIDELVSERPADRKKLFSQIIGIDELQKKAEMIKSLERRIRTGAEDFIVHREDLDRKREELGSIRKEFSSLSEKLTGLKEEYGKAAGRKESLGKEVDKLRSEVIALREKSGFLKERKEQIRELERRLEELNTRKKKFAETETEYNGINSDSIFQSRALVRSIDSDMKEAAFITSQLRELARRLQEIKVLKEKLQTLADQDKEYRKNSVILEGNEQKLQAEESFMSEYRGKVQERDRKTEALRALKEKISDIGTSIPPELLDLGKREIDEKLTALNSRKSEISSGKGSLETGIKHTMAAIDEISEKMDMLEGQQKCPVCGSELTGEHRDRVFSDYGNEIDSLREKERKAESDMKALEAESQKVVEDITLLHSQIVTGYTDLLENEKRGEKEIAELQAGLDSGKQKYLMLEEIGKEARTLRLKQKELEKQHSEYSRTEASIETLTSDSPVDKIEGLKKERDPIEERINAGLEKSGLYREKIPETVESLREMENRLQELKPSIEASGKIDDAIREVGVALKNAGEEVASLEGPVKQLGEKETAFSNMSRQFESSENDAAELKTKIDSLNGTLEQMQQDMKYRGNEIEKSEQKMKKYSSIQEAVKSLSEIRAALEKDGIQKYLRKESSEAITGKTRSLVSEFGLEIDDIRVSEDFDVEVSIAGAVESLSSLSGGEKTALAIALRLSVADYVLDRVSTFIMDEPTTFLDEDRRGQLKNILQNSLRDQNIIPQLIVITHHQELTKAADLVYLVKKQDGSSVVEPVY